MFKKALFLTIFLIQSVAFSAPVFQVKDMSVSVLNNHTVELVYKGEKVTVEKRANNTFSLNGKVFPITAEDTFEEIQQKIQKAYEQGKKRSAMLDQIFIQEAHAAVPAIFAAFMGGIFGLAIGNNMCKKNNDSPAATTPSYGTPTAPAATGAGEPAVVY